MSDAEEDVPPLDDFSDHFEKLQLQRQSQSAALTAAKAATKPVQSAAIPKATPKTADTSAQQASASLAGRTAAPRPPERFTAVPQECISLDEVVKPAEQTKKTAKAASTSTAFGGFSKGFLSGKSTSKTTASKPAEKQASRKANGTGSSGQAEDSMPFIRAQTKTKGESTPAGLTFPEVTEAMKASQPLLQNPDEWLTAGLQAAIASNPVLGPHFADPKFQEVIEEFQNNPQQTLLKHQGNTAVSAFLQEFCRVMGEHFTKLGEAQEASSMGKSNGSSEMLHPVASRNLGGSSIHEVASDEDERKMATILQKPSVQEALKNREVQAIIELVRRNPHEATRRMSNCPADVQRHIRTLVEAGILGINTGKH